MRCYKCGNELPPDSKFCQYCGEDLSSMNFCPFCGRELQANMNFCPQCGRVITVSTAPENSAAAKETEKRRAEEISQEKTQATSPNIGNIGTIKAVIEPVVVKETVESDSKPAAETQVLPDLPLVAVKANPAENEAPQTVLQQEETSGNRSASVVETKAPHSKKRWGWGLAACAIIVIALGIFLWPREANTPDETVEAKDEGAAEDVAEDTPAVADIANSVLYLEILNENDELIGTASGFLVNDRKTLVTNYHVVQDAYHIVAWAADGEQYTDVSFILAYDEIADLAILRCDSDAAVEPLNLGDSETVKQGDAIYAVGYPLGLANTLSDGIVSSRYIDEYDNDILQVTAAISEGNSGGPLLDKDGQVIGIMCAYYIYGQNLNIAITSNTLGELLDSGYQQTSLKYWKNRPAMPGSDTQKEDPQETEGQEPEIAERPKEGEQKEPTPEAMSPEQNIPPSKTEENIPQYDYSNAKGYSSFINIPDFASIWGIEENSFEDESYKDLYKMHTYTYDWADIKGIHTVCDDIYFNLLEQWGIIQTAVEQNQYGLIYTFQTSDGKNHINYSNYNNRVCVVLIDYLDEISETEKTQGAVEETKENLSSTIDSRFHGQWQYYLVNNFEELKLAPSSTYGGGGVISIDLNLGSMSSPFFSGACIATNDPTVFYTDVPTWTGSREDVYCLVADNVIYMTSILEGDFGDGESHTEHYWLCEKISNSTNSSGVYIQ